MRRQKNRISARGFTLMEMLIVVAIIAVLIGISIPIFGNVVKKNREALCRDDMRTLRADYTSLLLVYEPKTDAQYLKTFYRACASCGFECEEGSDSCTGACPEGGTLSAEFDATTGDITNITCDTHDYGITFTPEKSRNKFIEELRNNNSELYKYLKSKHKNVGSWDYPLPDSPDFGKLCVTFMTQAQTDLGIDLSQGSWRIYNWGSDGYSVYYTPSNIFNMTPGDTISITRWEVTGTGDFETYTGTTTITTKKTGSTTFNVINNAKKSELTKIE